jgi:hypothetical protein
MKNTSILGIRKLTFLVILFILEQVFLAVEVDLTWT